MIGQKLFSKQEAAKELRVSLSLLDHLTAGRKIGFLRLGHRIYFTEADLEGYLATRRSEAIPSAKPNPSKASTAAAPARRGTRAAAGAA